MQSTYMGQWGPGGPVVLVNLRVVFGPHTRWRQFISFVCTLRTIRVIGGLFFGSEAAAALNTMGLALPHCICRKVYADFHVF